MMNNWTADFPILAADENGNRLVYLDSAATTQHPKQVLDAVVNYYKKDNANPHRGVYELAMRATDAHEGARHTVAKFFNAEDDEIVFTQNTTEALNLVAYSYGMHFLHEGDEIVISVAEHHSNLVPWQRVAEATGAKLVYLYPGPDGRLTPDELDKKITEKTKLVGIAMVSNVLGLRACGRNCEACPRRGRCGGAGLRPERAAHPCGCEEAGCRLCRLLGPQAVRPYGHGRFVRPRRAAGQNAPVYERRRYDRCRA